jgi:hypothetical protein
MVCRDPFYDFDELQQHCKEYIKKGKERKIAFSGELMPSPDRNVNEHEKLQKSSQLCFGCGRKLPRFDNAMSPDCKQRSDKQALLRSSKPHCHAMHKWLLSFHIAGRFCPSPLVIL